VDITDNKLAKKIREAQLEQCVSRAVTFHWSTQGYVTLICRYNYILVVGEEERSSNTVNSRTRDNVVHGTKTLDEIIAEFKVMAESFQAWAAAVGCNSEQITSPPFVAQRYSLVFVRTRVFNFLQRNCKNLCLNACV
jgi:hypothetical protein